MLHEDDYCDRCGCELEVAQLTVEGLAVCEGCVTDRPLVGSATTAKRPEARDDGR